MLDISIYSNFISFSIALSLMFCFLLFKKQTHASHQFFFSWVMGDIILRMTSDRTTAWASTVTFRPDTVSSTTSHGICLFSKKCRCEFWVIVIFEFMIWSWNVLIPHTLQLQYTAVCTALQCNALYCPALHYSMPYGHKNIADHAT